MPPAVLFFVGLVAVMVVFLVINARRERQRTAALQQVANEAGLAFQPQAEVATLRALGHVPLFSRGHSMRVANLMSGCLDGWSFAVFDFWYTIGSGKNRRTDVQTVVLLPGARPGLPDLQMAPENPVTRLAEAFGYQDIDIDSSPEFSQRYILRGADDAAIRAALVPRGTTYFAAHEGWTIETQAGHVAIYRANSRPAPLEMRRFLAEACEAVRQL
jgi:hypothetical protein